MMVIGITGGIASGKSTVSKFLIDRGYIVIDADQIAREIVAVGQPALEDIKRVFGEAYIQPDGNLARKKLGELVFSRKEELKKLNKITHPRIIDEIVNRIKVYEKVKNSNLIFVDAALLIEMNMRQLVDEIWLVTVTRELQIKRLVTRDKLAISDAESRMGVQMPIEEKMKYADIIIDNSKDIQFLYIQIKKQLERVDGNFSEGEH
ncbi:MAG: dephospho-CoA kinase [Thermotaleaceae bacterium]